MPCSRLRVWPRSWGRRCVVPLLLISAVAPGVLAQGGGGQTLLGQFEDAVVNTIARCERAVVSITRSPQPLDRLANAPAPGARRNQRIFANGPNVPLGGALGALQTVTPTLGQPAGAGVVINSEAGLVLTQYLVVTQGVSHLVTDLQGNRYAATIRAADPRSGLAILQLQSHFPDLKDDTPIRLPSLPIGEAEQLRKGRLVVAIGNPFSIESDGQPTASWGSVTNTARKAPAGSKLNNTPLTLDGSYRTTLHHFGSLIQTDAKLGWNASGGALVNLDGELVGITTTVGAIAGHESPAGYAIPLNEAMRRAVDDLSRGRVSEYGFLGIGGFVPVRSVQTGALGIRVGEALIGGPAYRAGLRGGELITRIGGRPIRSSDALQLAVGSLPTSATTPVAYETAGGSRETQVTLGKAYVDPAGIIETRPRHPLWSGIRVDHATATPELQAATRAGRVDPEGCVLVASVKPESVSWKQGVRPYTFISHVSGQRVTTPDEFYEAVRRIEEAGENVRLKFTKPLAAGEAPQPQP